jgi:ribosomal protein L37E
MEIKQEHREWLTANINNYECAKNGYIRNLKLDDLKMYEHIYRTYLDPNFIVSVWCGACKFEMVMRLYQWFEKQINNG